MKRFIITSILTLFMISSYAQLSSPRVEPGTLVINNSGFKAASIRVTAVTRPTPMHTTSASINASFPARFVVAKADLSQTGTWAWACGWNTLANTNVSGVTAAIIPTGCAAYSEAGLDAIVGTWRLPTQREMNLLVISRFELAATPGFTQLGTNNSYWTSTQNNATQSWAATLSASFMYTHAKNTTFSVRCIRDNISQ